MNNDKKNSELEQPAAIESLADDELDGVSGGFHFAVPGRCPRCFSKMTGEHCKHCGFVKTR